MVANAKLKITSACLVFALLFMAGCTLGNQINTQNNSDGIDMGKTLVVKKSQDIAFCGGFLIYKDQWMDGTTLKADLGWSKMRMGKMISGGYAVGDKIALEGCNYYVKEIKSDQVVLEERK